jgi:hypothetical protein
MTQPRSIQSPPTRVTFPAAALLVILLAAALVRFIGIAAPSLWMDEIWSIEAASGRGVAHNRLPVNQIRTDNLNLASLAGAPSWPSVWSPNTDLRHPPLYYLLLRWWMDLFGTSPLAVRSLSAVFSLLATLVFFDLCRNLHGRTAGLLAAAMFAMAIPQIATAQDARNYCLAVLLSLCFADALIRIEKFGANRARLFALALSLAAMLLTHYLCLGVAAVGAAYALLRLRAADRRKTISTLILASLFTLAVWGYPFYLQMKNFPKGAPDFLVQNSPDHTRDTLLHSIGFPGQAVLGDEQAAHQPPAILIALSLLVSLVPLLRLRRRSDFLFWLLWLLGTLGLVIAADLFRQTRLLTFPRYTILATPAVYALLAAFDWPRRRLTNHILPIAVLAVMTIVACLRIARGVESKEPWRELSQSLDQNAAPNELLVFYGHGPWISPGMFYMGFKYYSPQSTRPWLILTGRPDATTLLQLRSRNSLWLVGLDPRNDGPSLLPGFQPLREQKTDAGDICQMIRASRILPVTK